MYKEDDGHEEECYIIGNNKTGDKRRCNGWCYLKHIHGILVNTQRGYYERPDM